MSTFRSTELFGGALVAELPTAFADVSAIRQVPDHQEIYLDTNGYTNVIFEVNERVAAEDASNDDEAIKYHLNDIVATETDTIKVWDQGTASLSKLPNKTAQLLLATATPAKGDRKAKEDFIGILLILIRLEEQKTDLLIAVNVPHIPGNYEEEQVDLENKKIGSHLETAVLIRQHILETFEIKDYSLFVSEE